MSLEGELTISLQCDNGQINSQIASSRPLHASRLFVGQSVDQVIANLPLLFNVCGKAQAVATLRAVESALQQPAAANVEYQREALIYLESLREQVWKVLLDWPKFLSEAVDPVILSTITKQLNELSGHLNTNKSLLGRSAKFNPVSPSTVKLWLTLKKVIEQSVLGVSSSLWLNDEFDINQWSEQHNIQTTRFILWLYQQNWKDAGASNIESLILFDDSQLKDRLMTEQYEFTAAPDWQDKPREVSWFSLQLRHNLIIKVVAEHGNGLYSRMVARLIGIAGLVEKLDQFFAQDCNNFNLGSNLMGMAHVNTARGRLTHSLQLDNETIEQLSILAPTEWNFHPKGVVASGLNQLAGSDPELLKLQASLLIHAVDPCVGYQLDIHSE